jgi:hypothetical protein
MCCRGHRTVRRDEEYTRRLWAPWRSARGEIDRADSRRSAALRSAACRHRTRGVELADGTKQAAMNPS